MRLNFCYIITRGSYSQKQIFLQVFGDTTSTRANSLLLFGPSHFMPFQIQCLVCNSAFTIRQEHKMILVFLLQLDCYWPLSVLESWWSMCKHGPNRTSYELQNDIAYHLLHLLLCRDLLQSLQRNDLEFFLAFVGLKCKKKTEMELKNIYLTLEKRMLNHKRGKPSHFIYYFT